MKRKILSLVMAIVMVISVLSITSSKVSANSLRWAECTSTMIDLDVDANVLNGQAASMAEANVKNPKEGDAVVFGKDGDNCALVIYGGKNWDLHNGLIPFDTIKEAISKGARVYVIGSVIESTTSLNANILDKDFIDFKVVDDVLTGQAIDCAKAQIANPEEETIVIYGRGGNKLSTVYYNGSEWEKGQDLLMDDLIAGLANGAVAYVIGDVIMPEDVGPLTKLESKVASLDVPADILTGVAIRYAEVMIPDPVDETLLIYGYGDGKVSCVYYTIGSGWGVGGQLTLDRINEGIGLGGIAYVIGTYSAESVITGWYQVDGKWYLNSDSGVQLTGWQNVNSRWYFLDASGAMKTGWLKEGNNWYYLDSSGAMATGWKQIGGTWYYFKPTGAMKTGWLSSGSTWYYLDASGAMVTGWKQVGGKWYFFNASGAMKTGWLKLGNSWYYLDASGAMATGWKQISGSWYYFSSNGVMASNTTINGYYVNANGVYVA